MDPIPEQEIEDLATTTGHSSWLALARWLRVNREATSELIASRSDRQDRVLEDLVREVREIKREGKDTNEQAKKTNGRVTDLEMERRINQALAKRDGERAQSKGDWEKLAAGAFFGAIGIGLVDLIVHFVGG